MLAPTAPIVKDITAIDSGSVRIEWNIPADTNGVLTIYTIYYIIENDPERSLIVPFNGQPVSHSCMNENIVISYVQYTCNAGTVL